MRYLKYIAMALALLAACAVIAAIAIPAAINTGHGRRLMINRINAAIPGRMTWERTTLSLFRQTLEIQEVSIAGPSGETIAGIERLFVDIDASGLLRRRVVISEVTVAGLLLDLKMAQDGRLNLVAALSFPEKGGPKHVKPETSPGWTLDLKSLALVDGTIRYRNGDKDFFFHARRLAADGRADMADREGRCHLHLAQARLESPGFNSRFPRFELIAQTHGQNGLEITLDGESTSSMLQAAVNIRNPIQNPAVDGEILLTTDLGDLATELNGLEGFTGNLSARLSIVGDPGNPEARLHAAYGGGRLMHRAVDSLETTISLDDRVLSIDQGHIRAFSGDMDITGMVDLRNAFQSGFLGAAPHTDAVSYDLSLHGNGLRISDFHKNMKPIAGGLEGSLKVSGSGFSPAALSARAEIAVSATGLRRPGQRDPVDVSAAGGLAFARNELRISRIDITSGRSALQAAGHVDIARKTFGANLSLNAPDLNETLMLLGLPDGSGRADVSLSGSGSFSEPVFIARVKAENFSLGEVALGDMDIQGKLNADGRLEMSTVRVENGASRISGTGTIKLFDRAFHLDPRPGASVQLDFTGVEPAQFISKELLRGRFDGTLNIDGNYPHTTARLDVRGTDIGVDRVFLGDVNAAVSFADGVVAVERARLANKKSLLKLAGKARLIEDDLFAPVENPTFELDIQSDAFFVQDFYPGTGGEFSIDIHAAGSIEDPVATIRLDGKNVRISENSIHGIHLNATLNNDTLDVENVSLIAAPGAYVQAKGWISKDRRFSFAADSSAIPIASLPGISLDHATSGFIRIDARGQGTLNHPDISGNLLFEDLQISGRPLEDTACRFTIKNGVAGVAGSLNFDVNGTYRFSDGDFDVQAVFDRTDLAPYFRLFEIPGFNGQATGRIKLAGKAGDPRTYAGLLDMDRLIIGRGDHPVLQGTALTIRFENNQISVPGLHLTLARSGELDISGTASMNGPVSIDAAGKLPLSMVSMMAKDIPDVTGDASFSIRLAGSIPKPDIEGHIRLNQAGATLPVTGQKLVVENADIHLTPKMLTVDTITGRLDNGTFAITGTAAMANLSPVALDLSLEGTSLPVSIPDMLTGRLNARLNITGTPDKSRIDGRVTLIEGLYYKDMHLNFLEGTGRKKRQPLPPSPREVTAPFLRNLALNITVEHRNPLVVDNNLATMEIVPDLKLTGTFENPVVSGRAEITSGTVTFRKKTFDIRKGLVDFVNPYKIEPVVDVHSEVVVRDWLITLKISGPPDALDFSLSSDPRLDDADILSLLIIGRTSREMIDSEGGSTRSAAQMLGQFVSSAVDDRLKEGTGLDIFEAEVQHSGESDGVGDVKVTLGKTLSERLDVKYTVESERGEVIQRAVAEYKFLENILLNGFQNNQGSFGGSVKYRLEFRWP